MATKKKTTTVDTIGLKVSGISEIQTAINNYISDCKKNINIGVSNATIQKAIKGSNSVNTLNQLAKQIDTKVESYLTALNQFSKQLDQVKSSYATADKNNTVFSTQTAKIKNA